MKRRKGFHREDIKAAIRKRGSSLKKLAEDALMHPSTCSVALRKPIPRANRIIADFIGIPLHDLWPRWYDLCGERINSSKKYSNYKIPVRHCKRSTGSFAEQLDNKKLSEIKAKESEIA